MNELYTRPELWIALTLGLWILAQKIHRLYPLPFLHPVPLTISLLCGALYLSGVDFNTYYQSTRWLHWMLGPATVALAFPLYRQWSILEKNVWALGLGLAVSCLGSLLIVYALGVAGHLSTPTLMASMTKSITTPIALATAKDFGSDPALAVLMVVLSGILGATLATPLLNLCKIHDPRARGFGVGIASHGLGAAVAFQKSDTKGAWAGLAMALNGILTPILLPLFWHFLH